MAHLTATNIVLGTCGQVGGFFFVLATFNRGKHSSFKLAHADSYLALYPNCQCLSSGYSGLEQCGSVDKILRWLWWSTYLRYCGRAVAMGLPSPIDCREPRLSRRTWYSSWLALFLALLLLILLTFCFVARSKAAMLQSRTKTD